MTETFADFLAGVAGLLAVVSFLPQAIQAWKTKSTKDVSAGTFFLLAVVALLWIVYGAIYRIPSLYLSNAAILIMECFILTLKYKYSR